MTKPLSERIDDSATVVPEAFRDSRHTIPLYDRPQPVAVAGDAVGEALRTDYVLEFVTETPADVTHQKLVSLGWTPPAAPCADAGALCIDCTPRNPDGACPDAAPAPVAGDDVGLHVLTGVFDKHGEELRAGDRIVIRIEGEHTKPEYWNPEYVIAWVAPRFTLRHVGGGLDSDTARWYFGLGTDQGYKMLELLDRPAALAQDRASQGGAADFRPKFKIARAAWRALLRAESEVERLQRYRNPNKRMRDDLFEHSKAVTINRVVLKHFFEKEFPGEETQG